MQNNHSEKTKELRLSSDLVPYTDNKPLPKSAEMLAALFDTSDINGLNRNVSQLEVERASDILRIRAAVCSLGIKATDLFFHTPNIIENLKSNIEESVGKDDAICEIGYSGNKISFYELDEFNPVVAPSNKKMLPFKFTQNIANGYYDRNKEKEARGVYNQKTLENTKELGVKSNQQLYMFALKYIKQNANGIELAERLNINPSDLTSLTPKQAIELSLNITSSLTKYDHDATKGGYNKADDITAIELLLNGLELDEEGKMKQLGVCRNYADTCGLIFNSFKNFQQSDFNRLGNTFHIKCGGGRETYDPHILRRNESKPNGGHAWNMFISQLENGSAAAVIVDPTMGGRKKKNKDGLTKFSYTMQRLEPIINHCMKYHSEDSSENIDEISEYYLKMIDIYNGYLTKAQKNENEALISESVKRKEFYLLNGLEAFTKSQETNSLTKTEHSSIKIELHSLLNDRSFNLNKEQYNKIADFIGLFKPYDFQLADALMRRNVDL